MPTVKPQELRELAARIFAATGAAQEDAAWIADLLVKANLRGHDSHGVIRVPQYVRDWKQGTLDPKARPVVVRETPTTAIVDGQHGYGQVVARRGAEVAIAKARAQNLSAVGLINCNHLGRLADYAELIMRQGLIALAYVNASGNALSVAPYGGRARRLSTNPLAYAIPTSAAQPFIFDIATSVVAEGKLRVKRNRKQPVPLGWIIDADGNPTADTARFYEEPRGALVQFAAHKGYGLSLLVEILGGILTTSGASAESVGPVRNGALFLAIKVDAFRPLADFTTEVDALAGRLRATPPAPGFAQVLVPGDPEEATERERAANGIFVEDETWNQIQAVARELLTG
jgi:uncharacterized oxidoreductase